MADKSYFRVSPTVLAPLGSEQLQDPALALLELIKNSWDADASVVEVQISAEEIMVRDNGHGMSRQDFDNRWLTIGVADKRIRKVSPNGRPLIGEKGLGRLSSYALGDSLEIDSSAGNSAGFSATINWSELLQSPSLDLYSVAVQGKKSPKGTQVSIRDLSKDWSAEHTKFLLDHLRFLTAVPDDTFTVQLVDPWDTYTLDNNDNLLEQVSEAHIRVRIAANGDPIVESCTVLGEDKSKIAFRNVSDTDSGPALAGAIIEMHFFRRSAGKNFDAVLPINKTNEFLKEYSGVRIYLNGINVPPYGIRGNDWASLEKLRTQTGGPTMTPGNSQLFGQVRLEKDKHSQFSITAGRSGFADQQAVQSLAQYVQWTARAIATARRAATYGIAKGEVPNRSNKPSESPNRPIKPEKLKREIKQSTAEGVSDNTQALERTFEEYESLFTSYSETEVTLRLYAQLASSGIAATSFAHELRADFDAMSSTVRILKKSGGISSELIDALEETWTSIKAFASLFQMMPVRVRRKSRLISDSELSKTTKQILKLAEAQGVSSSIKSDRFHVNIVPAELDSILLNLISNALKAVKESKNRSCGLLHVAFAAKGGSLVITVADNGCGVSAAVERVMYKPLEGSFGEGTGMGLPITQYLSSQYGGRVFHKIPGDSKFTTEFVVELNKVIRKTS